MLKRSIATFTISEALPIGKLSSGKFRCSGTFVGERKLMSMIHQELDRGQHVMNLYLTLNLQHQRILKGLDKGKGMYNQSMKSPSPCRNGNRRRDGDKTETETGKRGPEKGKWEVIVYRAVNAPMDIRDGVGDGIWQGQRLRRRERRS
ncbi:hypothetical protein L6452_05930 [Arctium lappa]|uniref:Uncharacterized protein n=1 Tax=Arctium lappa TaxID=4217 RepID=A0ACB9EHT4_ARCLA|nr:hypothetical protein L6452_05930 [Arctium lappa]